MAKAMEVKQMYKIDWKRKLTSRKFWAAVVGFVTALLIGFGMGENDVAQVTSIIMADVMWEAHGPAGQPLMFWSSL